MAFSGQVAAHRPHCTHFDSMKESCGASCLSRIAPSGHDPTQARHIVHVSRLTAIVPNGRARRQRDFPLRHRRVLREVVDRERRGRALVGRECERRGRAHRQRGRPRPERRVQRLRIGAVDHAKMFALIAQRLRDRVGDAHLALQRFDVLGRLRAGRQHRHLRRAVGQGREPDVESDGGDVMDFERNDTRWQPAAPPREVGDRRRAHPRRAGERRRRARRPWRTSRAAHAAGNRVPAPWDRRSSSRPTDIPSRTRRSPCTGAARPGRDRRRRRWPPSSRCRCTGCSRACRDRLCAQIDGL